MFNKLKEKIKSRRFLVVVLLLFFAVNIFAIFNTFTEKTTSSIWDGVVATKFKKGDGSALNPYVIDDGRELAYFFTLINGDKSEEYFNKFYTITNNIDLNGYDFSYSEFNKTFSGNLDGNGYTIFNFKIDKYNLDEENDLAHFNLFDSLYSANIKNINFSDITINISSKDIINERPSEKVESTASLIKKYGVTFVNESDVENNTTESENTTENQSVESPTDKKEETKEEVKEDIKVPEKTEEKTETKTEEKTEETNKTDETQNDESNNAEETDDKTTEEEIPQIIEPSEGETTNENEKQDEVVNTYVSNITFSLFRNVKQSVLTNISVNNIKINYSGDEKKFTSSLFVLDDVENNTFENININGTSNVSDTAVLILNYKSAELENIIYRNDGHVLIPDYKINDNESIYDYKIVDGKLIFDKDYPVKSILSLLNNNSNLKWKITNNTFKIENTGSDGGKKNILKLRRAAPNAHASGTEGTVVYINDYAMDANYYEGLNYTYSPDGHIPTTANKNIYNDNNLVYVQLNYYARDIDSKYRAAQSDLENYNQYTYYKVYPVENNEVRIPLIDNPFTLRPYNKVFNGWLTDYEGATIELDTDIYQRYVTIPVTKTSNVPDNININIYAVWTDGKVVNYSSSWSNTFSNLDASGFHAVNQDGTGYESVTPYYTRGSVNNNSNYPTGAVDYYGESLTGRCTNGPCQYYTHPTGAYANGTTYYKLTDHMETYTVQHLYEAEVPVGDTIAGFYRRITVPNGTPFKGYYNSNGVLQTSGTCNTSGGCTNYYELIQYYDSNGDPEKVINHQTYYYFTTRDTNVVVMTGSISRVWSNTENKPFTFTGITTNAQGNAVRYTSTSTYFNIYTRTVNCYADTRIENLVIYSNVTPQNNDSLPSGTAALIGNAHNVKIGRHIDVNANNRVAFRYVIGSTTTGVSQANFAKYKFEVESGKYNNIGLVTRDENTDYTHYVNAIGVFGNDYDRVTENPLEESDLEVRYTLSGSWSGYIRSANINDHIFHTTIKSGRYGTNKVDCYAGVYVGGQISGENYATRVGVFEGGWVYIITGGPLSQEQYKTYNDTQIYIKGGYSDVVFGGAGRSATYGNKIIQMTGGRVNYSIFGGSNGVLGNDSNYKGTIDGDSFVYVGGNATVGDPDLVSNNSVESETQVEAGSVFGIGNGRSGYNAIGSMNNSNVIINGGTINRNVYGGGNYGAGGQNKSGTTKIFIHEGEIKGSVYGGGNNNGVGTNNYTNNISIDMDGGKVSGSVYGGSRTKGTIYGSTDVKITAGTVYTDVYGGGEGGGTNGTFVNGNVDITIGDTTQGPTINGSVYGGSAFGTVNATSANASANNKTVKVTVNNGNIIDSVFGGAKGSTTDTPYVKGDITVDINGGTIKNVFGGFDQSGKPQGDVEVYLDGGTVVNAFGGGNQTSIDETNVYLRGSNVTTLYGGSNEHGDVLVTNINISGGQAGTVYGGNNEGDSCGSANITMSNGKITTAIFGGGNLVDTDVTHVTITGNTDSIPNVYGGGNNASVDETHILINGTGAKITNIYGGSNESGDVSESDVVINNGTVTTMYGGNNAGGTTATTNIDVNGGNITTIYGGGNKATSTTTNVNIDNTSSGITSVFGGGNEAACTTTNVTLNGNTGTITNVYGGGNKSGATTTNVTSTSANVKVDKMFGGSNQSGDVTTSNVIIQNGEFTTVFGGNNAGGETQTANVTMNNGKATTIYGGGNEAQTGETHVTINNSTTPINEIFGGGNLASTGDTEVIFNDGKVNSIYGGGNQAAAEDTTVTVKSASSTINNVYGGGNKAGAQSTTVTIGTTTSNFNVNNVYGGSNESGNVTTTDVTVNKATLINVYGGNNAGGKTNDASIEVNGSNIINLYGGGNEAATASTNVVVNSGDIVAVFGGGNAAGVDNNTEVKLLGGNVANNVYGGGNEGTVGGNTNVLIHNSNINGSAYAGGNGSTAIVTGDTTITVSGSSVIGTSSCSNYSNCGVFGGGNAAETGTVATEATATVNIAGGTIYGNVYGGANTSKVYGNTVVTIGDDVATGTNIQKDDVHIRGTVFGGGEANASGSATYDFSFISVTQGVTININGNGYNNFKIDGSIFGSGNASSSEGASNVTIKNYGTFNNPQYNVSIQRANLVTIDNSAIVLSGATDRTNEYSDILFSLSRVSELDVKNNTTLFLENGANLLESFKSLNADGSKATVTIDENTGAVTRSTNNRLYMYVGRHLDVAKDQNATDMGEVYGMSFFGMYKYNNDDTVNIGIYDEQTDGANVEWGKVFDNVTSYVAGLHKANHDITVDGFYTNFANEETQKYDVDYITPTPPTGPLYMWIIGAGVIEYEVELNASRYSTLGTTELSLRDFTHPNTTFSIIGFDYSELEPGVELIDKTNVKKIADNSTEANHVMGVSMETSNAGWLNNGQTSFISDPDDPIGGTTSYVKGNYSGAPTVLLYLHHSKNIATAGSLGKVKIQLMSIRQTGPLDKETKRLIITLDLNRTLYDTISYEGSMTAGRKYEMFASTATNISSTSSISAYYALFATDENIYKTGFHRTLVSTFAFPENTKITMIDLSGSTPEYYYKVISASDYQSALSEMQNIGEVSYNVSMFEAMGAENSGVFYDDVVKNTAYYSSSPEYCEEEFIFIIDFADTTINSDYLNNKLLLEMRNSSDATIYSVLAPQHADLTYNIYANRDAVIEMGGTISSNKIYAGETFNVDLTIDYTQSTVGSVTVYDTHYFDSKLGIKISLINSDGNVVTGTTLLGLHYDIDEVRYDPNIDGTARIKIADKVDSAEKWVIIDTGTSAIASGNYKLRIESFGSPDGIYYGLTASDMIEFDIEIVNEIYGLNVETTPEEMIINSETGKNENDENKIGYTILYNSGLTEPNIRFKLYRRNYATIDDTTYSLVDAADYFSDELTASSNEKEYIISSEPLDEFNIDFTTKSELTSGTYKMVFELYDDDAMIGTVDKYFIIK